MNCSENAHQIVYILCSRKQKTVEYTITLEIIVFERENDAIHFLDKCENGNEFMVSPTKMGHLYKILEHTDFCLLYKSYPLTNTTLNMILYRSNEIIQHLCFFMQ